ncbi:hypothetical protein [Streptomyces sp. NPDC048639]|uniref:hypothetical protein n=1 Tax=Streptomyces sp. NPDC048639 TaxID=3365581 RepID=UPI00371B83BA
MAESGTRSADDDTSDAAPDTDEETSATRGADDGAAGSAPEPAADPPADPPAAPSPGDGDRSNPAPGDRPSALRALRQWHSGLGTSNRLALYGLVCAVLAYVTPIGQAVYDRVSPESAMAFLVEQADSPCFADYILTPGNERLRGVMWSADQRQFPRWQKEGKAVHANRLQVGVNARGNGEKAVAIRDISISVVSRGKPVRGAYFEGGKCGADGRDLPEYLVVDLDTLPLKQDVPVTYLQHSELQKDARKTAKALGDPITLPHDITQDGVYSFFLTGRTKRFDCEWVATITWWDGEKEHKDRIDNDGRPFRVSASAT